MPVRCSFDGIPTVRFGAISRCRETYAAGWLLCFTSYGAAFRCRKTYGAVRCGFQEDKNKNTTLCGAARNRTELTEETAP